MSLRNGTAANGVRVKLGRVHELISTSCIQNLDFLSSKIEQGYLNSSIEVVNGEKRVDWQALFGGLK